MDKISFFTPITFRDPPKSYRHSLLQIVDSYFYLGGKKACVIPGHVEQGYEGALLASQNSPSFVLTALKIVSYCTIILPLFMLATKAILRSQYKFHFIDLSKKLGEGIEVSKETLSTIERLLPKIIRSRSDPEILWYSSGRNLIFSLKSNPQIIFKMTNLNRSTFQESQWISSSEINKQRFKNMETALHTCWVNNLNLLTVPHAKTFNINGNIIIAEEKIDICQHESVQEELYQNPHLEETVKQLVTFIAKTGFNDVTWRNIPIIKETTKVALIDLEEMQNAKDGIFGGSGRGLIRCLQSEKQIDIALKQAELYGISHPHITKQSAKANRMKEIQEDQKLQQFYVQHGIAENPRKMLQVNDLSSLGLNLAEEFSLDAEEKTGTDDNKTPSSRKITLKDAVTKVIDLINQEIKNSPENASTKGKRYILLNTKRDQFLKAYHCIHLSNRLSPTSIEDLKQTWLGRIIEALVSKEHLFKLVKIDHRGYLLQA